MDFELTIISENGLIYSGKCSSLIIPVEDGLYGIKANHANTAAAVSKGTITVKTGKDDEQLCFETGSGFLTFENNRAQIVTDECSPV